MKESLPVEIAPDAVNTLRRRRMERNRHTDRLQQTWPKLTSTWGRGCQPEYEYMKDEYDRRFNAEREERQRSIEKRICKDNWRCVSQEARLKHEAMIPGEIERYPYIGGDQSKELRPSTYYLRSGMTSIQEWNAERCERAPTERIQSTFLTGKGSGLEDDSRTSRMTLPNVVSHLQKRVDADWEGSKVVVITTEQDLVQVAFQTDTVDSERGMMAYMNILSKDVEFIGSAGLRKVSSVWGTQREFPTDDNDSASTAKKVWSLFVFAPKWVHLRLTDPTRVVAPKDLRMVQSPTSPVNSPHASMRLSPRPLQLSGGLRADGPEKMQLSLLEMAVGGLPRLKER